MGGGREYPDAPDPGRKIAKNVRSGRRIAGSSIEIDSDILYDLSDSAETETDT